MFRSESVLFYKLVIPSTNAWEVIDNLGHLGYIHVKDMNKGA